MFGTIRTRLALGLVAIAFAGLGTWVISHQGSATNSAKDNSAEDTIGDSPSPPSAAQLESRYSTQVRPFLEKYCVSCHGANQPEADLDLTRDSTVAAIASNPRRWDHVRERLQSQEMPPEDAPRLPQPRERAAVLAWLRDLRAHEAQQHAGEPGTVLARRLSNAELDYTVHDLTGVDMRPTKEFPVDPANEAGFDNSGESLAMSPALLKKYFAAARQVADHVLLKPQGFVFAPYPVVTETDRDKYCVQRILDFYQRHNVDLADYFLVAWQFRHANPTATSLESLAAKSGLSAKYLAIVWSALTEGEAETGPTAAVRKLWNDMPASAGTDTIRPRCERIRNLVVRLRSQLKPNVKKVSIKGISDGSQPLVLWNNRQLSSRHRSYSGDAIADMKKLGQHLERADANLADFFVFQTDAEIGRRLHAELERFCAAFPDAFLVSDRGPYFNPDDAGKGRPLTAGFHLMQGYFRDDDPLYELILDEPERRELDALWFELNFMTLAPMRQYKDFIFFERAEPPRFMREAEFDFARSEDKDCISEEKMDRLAQAYLAKARKQGASGDAEKAIASYFSNISAEIRRVEQARLAAEPSHLAALVTFAERAYRRPLSPAEREDLLAFYDKLRKQNELSHEEALRDTVVTVLMSPHFYYRFDLVEAGPAARPLPDYALASRLSYFLWSSMPDAELLSHAAAGDLHEPKVLIAQARRMLRDTHVRGLATEFAGNLLDIRRFEEHNAVDRDRFPSFTNELRQAMFEEPIHYFINVAQRNRSVLDLLYADDTFVNRPLAQHYGMPELPKGSNEWVHVEDAKQYGRGGMLPMAVFLTKNAPGLRTSPVKRGYWVVRRVLGEQIPPPPPTVPELPTDEAKLGDMTLPQVLARHRANPSCAGCHRRFDAVGLAFENFGPIGDLRSKDLGGRPVETRATFPDGSERSGLQGLRDYIRDHRQDDYLDNLCRKLLTYALGRGLQPSDTSTIDTMRSRLVADDYAFGSLIEVIVTSPQFLNKRGDDGGD